MPERPWILALLVGCAAAAVPAVAAAPPPGATSCSGCHAAATTTAIPPLRGLTAAQIEAALLAYRSGERAPTVMDRIAKGFSDREIADLAAWFGQGG